MGAGFIDDLRAAHPMYSLGQKPPQAQVQARPPPPIAQPAPQPSPASAQGPISEETLRDFLKGFNGR